MAVSLLLPLQFVIIVLVVSQWQCTDASNDTGIHIQFSPSSVKVEISDVKNISLSLSHNLQEAASLYITYEVGDSDISYVPVLVEAVPNISLAAGDNTSQLQLQGKNAGTVFVGVNSSSQELTDLEKAYITVTVVHSLPLDIIIIVIGWIYFAAWSVSFFPQVYLNWSRKSVIGLNFDYLGYNWTGFLAYGFFNVGMYWIPDVKDAYHDKHPRGVNPVRLNDVVFTLLAVVMTTFIIFQCLIYERGGQRVSRISSVILACAWLFSIISLFLAVGGVITWLTYLYYFSYLKLGVTVIKYIPQAFMNFRRKSTEGWSIGNILLDCTGGTFSLLQMFMIAYNNDDWSSIFGDPTKFGLGVISILFDIIFIVQHYCLYRGNTPYHVISEVTVSS